jgi:hypothetical protein
VSAARTALIALIVLLFGAAGADAETRAVPQGWLGVTADGPFDASDATEWRREGCAKTANAQRCR